MDVDAPSISYLAVDTYRKDERERLKKRMKAIYSNSPSITSTQKPPNKYYLATSYSLY